MSWATLASDNKWSCSYIQANSKYKDTSGSPSIATASLPAIMYEMTGQLKHMKMGHSAKAKTCFLVLLDIICLFFASQSAEGKVPGRF